MIVRRGNETAVGVGGVVIPRHVKVTTATPEGPVVTRFTLPSNFQTPHPPLMPGFAPAGLQVQIPDNCGLVYVEGELVRTHGTVRHLESPPLQMGQSYPLHVRAAFAVGDKLLIEDKQVLIRPGESTSLTFDGSQAISVPLPGNNADPSTGERASRSFPAR
jgi:uncharacterized protein (TIGR03000 family)